MRRMAVRTFQARTASEALRSIKDELGSDAIILGSRTLPTGAVEVEASRGHLVLVRDDDPGRSGGARTRRRPIVRANLASDDPPPMPDFLTELEPIREMLRDFLREADVARRHGIPPVASPTFLALVEAGVAEGFARAVALDAAQDSGAADEVSVRRAARKVLASRVPCGGDIRCESGERKVVAFVGPTGVGKTTVLSKVAAVSVLRDRLRVGLIAADATRLGAIDQVRRFADVLGAPFAIALTRDGLREGLAAMHDTDLVLIDTGGRAPRQSGDLDALRTLFERPPCRIERHLCLASNTKERDTIAAIEAFRTVGYQRLCFTKLDETESFGGIYLAARAAKRPLSYLTRAPQEPDALDVASAEEIAALILPPEGDEDAADRG